MIRNISVVVAAIIAGIVALQPFMLLEMYLTEGKSFRGLGPQLLFYSLIVLPSAVAAACIGAVAAYGIRTAHPQKWASGMAVIVGALLVVSHQYVAPEWFAWVTVAIEIVVPTGLTWLVFRVVWARRHMAAV